MFFLNRPSVFQQQPLRGLLYLQGILNGFLKDLVVLTSFWWTSCLAQHLKIVKANVQPKYTHLTSHPPWERKNISAQTNIFRNAV